MQHFYSQVQNALGVAIPGVTVTVYFTGTLTTATLYSDDGITVTTNPVVTDNLGRFNFYVATGRYDLAYAGGTPFPVTPYSQTNVEISDITQASVGDAGWVSPVLTTTTTINFDEQATLTTPPAGVVTLGAKTDNNLYIVQPSGTIIGPLGAGGGGSPAGPVNTLQKNAAGSFGASTITDNGSSITMGENVSTQGPNPYYDITAYGGRATARVDARTNVTANIGAGSSNCAITSAYDFVNGDGVVIYGAGPTCTLAAPGGVAVTPSQAITTGSGLVVPSSGGATTYSYQVVAVDQNGGCSPASVVASTTTGVSALGQTKVTISSHSRVSNVVTVTTSGPHGFAVGATVVIPQSGSGFAAPTDVSFTGMYVISGVTSNTFTYQCGQATYGGATTSATGGTAIVFACNHITWTAVPNAWRYLIYKGGVIFGESFILSTYYDDYGPALSGTPGGGAVQAWIPSSAPAAATNDYLSTSIVSGGGTTSLVLANAATNAVSAGKFQQDNTPAFLAACNARNLVSVSSAGGVAPVRIPACLANNQYFNFNSFCNTPESNAQPLQVVQVGNVMLNETMLGATEWVGGGTTANTSFTWKGLAWVTSFYGGTLFYGGQYFQGLFIQGNVTFDAAVNVSFDFCALEGLGPLGVACFFRGLFTFTWRKCVIANGAASAGTCLTPTVLFQHTLQSITGNLTIGSDISVEDCWVLNGGFQMDTTGGQLGGTAVRFVHVNCEDMVSPLLMFTGPLFPGYVYLEAILNSDNFIPTLGNFGALENVTACNVTIPNFCTGNLIGGIALTSVEAATPATIGQNIFMTIQSSGSIYNVAPIVGGAGGASNVDGSWLDMRQPQHFPAGHTLYWDLAPPTGLATAVASGGSVPVGTHTYQIAAQGLDGGLTLLSTGVNATTTAGNQLVNLTWNAEFGAFGYWLWRDGVRLNGTVITGTTFSDPFPGATGGSPMAVCGTGAVSIGPSWVITPLSYSYGGVAEGIKSVSTTYTALQTDGVILANATGGSYNVTLSTTNAVTGQIYKIMKTDASANTVTIGTNSGTINGSSTVVLSTQYSKATIHFDGTNWWSI